MYNRQNYKYKITQKSNANSNNSSFADTNYFNMSISKLICASGIAVGLGITVGIILVSIGYKM